MEQVARIDFEALAFIDDENASSESEEEECESSRSAKSVRECECDIAKFRRHEDCEEDDANSDEDLNGEGLPHLINPKIWYRHPILRIFIAFMILIMDFLTYGEDPISDSHIDYNSVGTGQVVGPMAIWYAPSWYYTVEKMFLLILALVLGYFGGQMLRIGMVKARIGAFKSDGGLITCLAISFVVTSFFLDIIYNTSLEETDDPEAERCWLARRHWVGGCKGNDPESWEVESHSMQFLKTVFFLKGTRYKDMGVMWQTFSAAADWLAIYQLLDCVFQDKKDWPEFMPGFKDFYLETLDGKLRTWSFFILLPVTVILTAAALRNTGDEPGQFNWELRLLGGYNEIGRSLFAGVIIAQDLLFVVQDPGFPLFGEGQTEEEDVNQPNLAGTNSQGLQIGKWTITARWLQYGPIFLVANFDMLYLKSMFMYTPQQYGQYASPVDSFIYVVTDKTLLNKVYPLGVNKNATLLEQITYEARRNLTTGECLSTAPSCITDIKTTSMYHDSGWDYAGLVVGLCSISAFLAAIRIGSRQAMQRNAELLENAKE